MRGAVVHDPEHSPGLAVGVLGHHLVHQPFKGSNSGMFLATAKKSGSVNIKRREVRPGPAPLVFVFNPYRFPRLGRQSRMFSSTSLNGCFLICRQNKLVILEQFSFKYPFVQIENPASFSKEIRVTRKNPASVLPRFYCILGKSAPNSAVADLSHQTYPFDFPDHIGNAHPRKRISQKSRQFTSQGFYRDNQFWGEKPGDDRGVAVLRDLPDVDQRTSFATCKRSLVAYPSVRRYRRWKNHRQPKGLSWLAQHDNTVTYILLHDAPVHSFPHVIKLYDRGFFSAW